MFNTNVGCFDRFKSGLRLHNNKITGEAVSANEDEAFKYPAVFKNVNEDGGHTDQLIFNVYETGLCWERMPSRTYFSKKENLNLDLEFLFCFL
jgi:hypothetical protein